MGDIILDNSKIIFKDSGSNVLSQLASTSAGEISVLDSSNSVLGDVVKTLNVFGTDNVIIRSDGTGKNVQPTTITVDDDNNITSSGYVNVVRGGNTSAYTATISGDVHSRLRLTSGGSIEFGLGNVARSSRLGKSNELGLYLDDNGGGQGGVLSLSSGMLYGTRDISLTPNIITNAGTASQTGVTVTGTGTSFTTSMVGGMVVWYGGGYRAMIVSVESSTSLTVDRSQTVPDASYVINYGGITMSNSGVLNVLSLKKVNSINGITLDTSNNVSNISTLTLSNGLLLPTTGGIASVLDYFENNTTHTTTFTAGYTTTGNVNIRVMRIGALVVLHIPVFTGTWTSNGVFASNTDLPVKWRPVSWFSMPIQARNNGVSVTGLLTVSPTDGNIQICASIGGGSFTAGSIGLNNSVCVTYLNYL